MTLQRIAAFLFLAATIAASAVVAQTSQPQTAPAPLAPAQILTEPQAPPAAQSPSTQPGQAADQPAQEQTRWRRIRVIQIPGNKPNVMPGNNPNLKQLPDGPLDPGIYLRLSANADVCATIMSYNFSQGENPRLENVTTCTPVKSVRPLKVNHEKEPPPPPALLEGIAAPVQK